MPRQTDCFASASTKYVNQSLSRLGLARSNTLPSRTPVDAERGHARDEVRMTAHASNLFDREAILHESGNHALAAVGPSREIGLRHGHRG